MERKFTNKESLIGNPRIREIERGFPINILFDKQHPFPVRVVLGAEFFSYKAVSVLFEHFDGGLVSAHDAAVQNPCVKGFGDIICHCRRKLGCVSMAAVFFADTVSDFHFMGPSGYFVDSCVAD